MEQRKKEKVIELQQEKKMSLIERIGKKIPDPVIIFAIFYVVVLFATLIYTAIKLAVTSIAFWVKFAQSYLFMVYQISDFAKYPMGIYPNFIKAILTGIIPFAFTGYFPGAYFLGKGNFVTGVCLTVVVSIVAIIIAYSIWLTGMKRYESSGS